MKSGPALEELLIEMSKRRQEVYVDPTWNLLGGKCPCSKPIRDCKHLQDGSERSEEVTL
jgi:hypothetical protein